MQHGNWSLLNQKMRQQQQTLSQQSKMLGSLPQLISTTMAEQSQWMFKTNSELRPHYIGINDTSPRQHKSKQTKTPHQGHSLREPLASDSLFDCSQKDLNEFSQTSQRESKWGYPSTLLFKQPQNDTVTQKLSGTIKEIFTDTPLLQQHEDSFEYTPAMQKTSLNFKEFKRSPKVTDSCNLTGKSAQDKQSELGMTQRHTFMLASQQKLIDHEVERLKNAKKPVLHQGTESKQNESITSEYSYQQSVNHNGPSSSRFKMFKSKDKQSVHSILTQRLESFSTQTPNDQKTTSNLSALKKCHVLFKQDASKNRQHVLRQITKKDAIPPKSKSAFSSYQPCLSNLDMEESPHLLNSSKYSSSGSSFRKRLSGRNSLCQQIDQLMDQTGLNDHDLWKKLHDDIEKRDETPLCQSLSHFMKGQDLSIQKQPSYQRKPTYMRGGYKQTKYLGLGEIGEHYARMEYEQNLINLERDIKLVQAAKSKVFEPWTGERVVQKFSKERKQQVTFLMEREKGENHDSNEKKMNKNFVSKVDTYVHDLTVSQNMEFLSSTPALGDQNQSRLPGLKNYSLKKMESLTPKHLPLHKQTTSTQRDLRRRPSNTNLNIDLDSYILKQQQPYNMYGLVDQLMSKMSFHKLCKQSADQPSIMKELLKGDPRQQYFEDCRQAIEPALDLFGKIQDGSLVLEEYSLREGQCTGFMRACEVEPDLVKEVIIDNCSLTGAAFQFFLKGLCSLKKISNFTIKRMQLDSESAGIIAEILRKATSKRCVDDFRMERCTLNNEDLENILQSLVSGSNLQKLAIVGQSFTSKHVMQLQEYILTAKVNSVDLSWTRVQAVSFLPLLKAICQNRKLVYINLAWIKLLKNSNFSDHGFERRTTQVQTPAARSSAFSAQRGSDTLSIPTNTKLSSQPTWGAFDRKKSSKGQHKKLDTLEQEVMDSLLELFQKNSMLFHIDLSETGLTQDIIKALVKPIRDSTSLIGVHLTGNPGMTPEVERLFIRQLNATFENTLPLESFQSVVGEDLRSKIPEARKDSRIMESMFLKQLHQEKRHEIHENQGKAENAQMRHFILTRKIGHQLEIPGSSDWQLHRENSNQCYICDRKIYTVFFWSPSIGQIEGYDTGLSSDDQYRIAKLILDERDTDPKRHKTSIKLEASLTHYPKRQIFNEQLGDFQDSVSTQSMQTSDNSSSDSQSQHNARGQTGFTQQGPSIRIPTVKQQKTPLLYGNFNNWQPQPMISVGNLAIALKEEEVKPDFIDKMRLQGLCREEVSKVSQMRRQEREVYAQMIEEYRMRFFKDQVWTTALNKLIPYKEPHFSSVQNVKYIDTRELYVGVNFIGCGRQDYVVQKGNQFYFHQTIADFRKEPIVFANLQISQKGKKERNPNVFKKWIVDTPQIIETCAKVDFDLWKVQNFVKEPADQKDIKRVVMQYYVFLKDVFTEIAARSNFPCITSLECGVTFSECDLLDKNFTQGIMDTQFIASRVDVAKNNYKVYNQNILDCNRFEFMECIVRIANNKFKQTGECQTTTQAIDMLIDCLVKSGVGKGSQQWREQYLWTRDCNLTLDANLDGIKKLYDKQITSKIKKLSMAEAMHLMTSGCDNIVLSDNQARFCYAMSLQTTPDIVKNSFMKCLHIEYLEFLEMIGRVAFCAFQEDLVTPLHEKINKVLDEWLGLVGQQRVEPEYFMESGSEDEDY